MTRGTAAVKKITTNGVNSPHLDRISESALII